jgi:phosphotransferase system HPr (HPr) family protein
MNPGASGREIEKKTTADWRERTVVLRNRHGLHMRPATKLYTLANQYQAAIEVAKDGRFVNGKSIMELLTLAAASGTELVLRADGEDAEQALDALQELIDGRFGE